MRRIVVMTAAIALTAASFAPWIADFAPVYAQGVPKALQEGGPDNAIRERKNAWTIGIAGGLMEGTYMRFADEIAKILDDGDNLRVLPMVSYGAAGNLVALEHGDRPSRPSEHRGRHQPVGSRADDNGVGGITHDAVSITA